MKKDDAIHLLRNADVAEKSGTLQNIEGCYHI